MIFCVGVSKKHPMPPKLSEKKLLKMRENKKSVHSAKALCTDFFDQALKKVDYISFVSRSA